MSPGRWARIVAGVQRRTLRRTRVVVLRATPTNDAIAMPAGCALVRIDVAAGEAGERHAERAMQAVGEASGLVAARLAHGDELLGWQEGDDIVSFGWLRHRERMVGSVRLVDAPGRCFLYNFHTRADRRGRRLYPALLLALRSLLGREGVRELFAEVNVHNAASARGAERAGFVPVGELAWLTLADRWTTAATASRRDGHAACPF
jgi:RimJ/RimL family protein N-acetyltransferase